VLVYQPSSFVIWGGNTPGVSLGQRLQFWGAQWSKQVAGGDYAAQADFKGYGTPVSRPIGICQAAAHTTGTPRLDPSCWTSKPGNSTPSATVGDYIGVIVSTAINQDGSTVYGNVAALVVLQVDRTVPYGSDPDHPGYGTIVAVIADGAGLFPQAASPVPATASTAAAELFSAFTAVAAGSRQYFLYAPDRAVQRGMSEAEVLRHLRSPLGEVWFYDSYRSHAAVGFSGNRVDHVSLRDELSSVDIAVGMSKSEVEGLLGSPKEKTFVYSRSRGDKSYHVRVILFRGGKVIRRISEFYLD
jgi:hypothetical protein